MPEDPIRIRKVEVLHQGWSTLKRVSLDHRFRDGRWRAETREVFERGHACAVVPHDPERDTVLLVRSLRVAPWLAGHRGPMIEACAGMIDGDEAPEAAMLREAEEELGVRLRDLRHLFGAFLSPGASTERLSHFAATYAPADRVGAGGGLAEEGEDIEVLEMSLDAALGLVGSAIVDAKTIVLLQRLQLARAGLG